MGKVKRHRTVQIADLTACFLCDSVYFLCDSDTIGLTAAIIHNHNLVGQLPHRLGNGFQTPYKNRHIILGRNHHRHKRLFTGHIHKPLSRSAFSCRQPGFPPVKKHLPKVADVLTSFLIAPRQFHQPVMAGALLLLLLLGKLLIKFSSHSSQAAQIIPAKVTVRRPVLLQPGGVIRPLLVLHILISIDKEHLGILDKEGCDPFPGIRSHLSLTKNQNLKIHRILLSCKDRSFLLIFQSGIIIHLI